jgi:glycosyltransferase involved in cell wall biosynthesis
MSINQIEMVTIIVRTVGRASLTRALESILLQTHPIFEVVVVNAGCSELILKNKIFHDQQIKILTPNAPLKRSAAANFGLQQATGHYCLFLDDDDWIHPEHIRRLMDTLNFHPDAILAYSDVECIQSNSLIKTHVFDSEFSHARLLAENYIPIHAALFRHEAWEQGCRFDESFDFHEDWDFWIQLAHLARFVHCPGISATYVLGDEGSGIWQKQENTNKSMQRIYEKWWKSWTAQGTLAYFQSLRDELFSSHEELSKLHRLSTERAQKQQAALFESMKYTESLASHLERKELELKNAHDQIDKEISKLHLLSAEHAQKQQAALLESIRYAESLAFHLERKEVELKNALDQIASTPTPDPQQSRAPK